MAITCQQCHASQANLRAEKVHLEPGTVLLVVTCRLCGWSKSKPAPTEARKTVTQKPTTKKPEEPMSTKGTCKKCHTEDVTIISRGLCYKCRTEEISAGTIDQNYPAKKGPGPRKTTTEKPPKNALPDPGPATKKQATTAPIEEVVATPTTPEENELKNDIITIAADRDRELLEKIVQLADQERRTPAMQAIHLLASHPKLIPQPSQGIIKKALAVVAAVFSAKGS